MEFHTFRLSHLDTVEAVMLKIRASGQKNLARSIRPNQRPNLRGFPSCSAPFFLLDPLPPIR